MTDIIEQEKLSRAIAITANQLHADWQTAHFQQKGAGAPRWKDLKEASIAWIAAQPDQNIYGGALQTIDDKQQINIAALPNSVLPPQFSGENTAAATGAIEAVLSLSNMEERAALVHEQWLGRNSSWAADELKVPYAKLSEPEKEKDRVIVRAAETALKQVGLLPSTVPSSHAGSAKPANQK